MSSRFPVESRREAAGVGTAAGLVFAAVVGVAFAPPGDAVGAVVAVGCFLVAAPPFYVAARADPAERGVRLRAYVAAWIALGLCCVGLPYAWFVARPGAQGVGGGLLLLLVGPGAWLAAAAALRLDPRGLVRFGAAVAALATVGVGGGRVLQSRVDALWLPEAGFAAGLVGGLLAGAVVYRWWPSG